MVRGDLIAHAKFGKGVVVAIESSRAEILFAEGIKKLGQGVTPYDVSRPCAARSPPATVPSPPRKVPMKYRRSGGSRLEVSTLCLGAMTFGEADEKSFMHGVGADEATAFAIMDLTPFVSNQAQYSLLVRELEREHVLEALGAVSAEAGRSVSQVALAWMAQRPGVSSVIFGARTLAQLDDNLGAADLALTDAQMKRLDEASAFEVGYPYDFIQSAQGRW